MALPVIILGASGLTGRHAASLLLADTRCSRLIAPVRRPIALDHPKLETLALSPDPPPLPSAPGAALVVCLGSTIRAAGSRERFREIDYDLPLAYARAALASGAERCVLVSSVGASAASPNFYLRVKGELEAALAQLGFASLDIFRPSFLLGPRAESRPLERLASPIASLLAPLLFGSLSVYRPIHAATVARALTAAALAEPFQRGTRVHHWREIVSA